MGQKIYTSVNTFNGGEISELLFNREDISKYKSSCRVLENAFPLVEGGAKKMPGTYFAGHTQNSLAPARLVPFQFSTNQGAILEFTAGIIRIWSPTSPGTWTLGLVESGGTPIQLTTPYLQSDLFQLDCGTQSADVLWIFHPSYPPACVERLGPSTWQYATAPPGGPPVGPGDPAYYGTDKTISTGYSGIGVSILQMTQAFPLVMITDSKFDLGDRVYINGCAGMVELNEGQFFVSPVLNSSDVTAFTAHIDDTAGTPGAGIVLTVSAVASGTILVGMQVTGPNVTPNTIITDYLSGTGGTGTYQVNIQQKVVSVGMTGTGGFCYNLIPVPVLNKHSGIIFTGSIAGTTLTITAVIAGVILGVPGLYFPGVAGGTAIVNQLTGTPGGVGTYTVSVSQTAGSQQMSTIPVVSTAFLPYAGGGFASKVIPFFAATGDYPSCGTFYQGRLCAAGSNNHPTRFFGSVVEDFPDFIADPTADDYSLQFDLQSTLLDQIVSMLGTPNALLLGTAGGAWVITGANGSDLTPSSVNASKQTSIGVNQLQPQLIGDSAVFVSRSAKQVMFVTFDFATNEWNTFDLTRLNRQVTIGPSQSQSGIIQTAFQSEPYPIFWAVRADGQLLGLVFNKQDQVFAWFRVNMLPENGIIESVAVISGENEEDMVVIEVNRNINGNIARYVEYFYPQELFNDLNNAFFVHCGLKLDLGSPVGITGITNANPCVVTAPGHSLANGDFVQIADVIGTPPNSGNPSGSGMWQVNQDKTQAYTVAGTDIGGGTFQLQGVDSTAWGPYIGGGTTLPVTNEVTGMNYLLGRSVVAVGDCNLILPPTVVTGNTMTFDYYCAKIVIGLPYRTTIQPTNPVISSPTFSTRGQKQKLNRATISLYQSLGGKYGIQDVPEHMYEIDYGPGSRGEQP